MLAYVKRQQIIELNLMFHKDADRRKKKFVLSHQTDDDSRYRMYDPLGFSIVH